MDKYTDEELLHTLSETKRLLDGIEEVQGEEFSLESILAEFGHGAAESSLYGKPEPTPTPFEKSSPAQETAGSPESTPAGEHLPVEAPISEKTAAQSPVSELVDTRDLRRTIAGAVEQVMEQKPAVVPSEDEITKDRRRMKIKRRAADSLPPKKELPAEKAIEVKDPSAETEEFPIEGAEKAEAQETQISLEQVMFRTVDAVMDEEREETPLAAACKPSGRKLSELWTAATIAIGAWLSRRREGKEENPFPAEDELFTEPEIEMEQAVRDEKRLCKKLRRSLLLTAVPMAALIVLSVLDAFGVMPETWRNTLWLRFGAMGGLLLFTMLMAAPVWKKLVGDLKDGRPGCELAAGLNAIVALEDCIFDALMGQGDNLPFTAPAAVLLWLCLWGMLLHADSRREAFRLADLGGEPPYAVAVTSSGTCKQQGKLAGFYHITNKDDPTRRIQKMLVPLLLSAATVLTGVVCLSDQKTGQFLWFWSAMLTAATPLSLPLTGILPLKWLNRRLVKSGSAVAGYCGAAMVGSSNRMVLTDSDLFPAGTVELNGLKVYGEEISKVASYAATVSRAANSHLAPLFDHLLSSEGGTYRKLDDLRFYEEGGFGGTIHGETVTMGSAYFMKQQKVNLPREMKLKTGVFLAVDGQLIAIFAVKYQASRNVEWALQAIRRSRIRTVLAVRNENITPGMLHRKFNLDIKPLYPDVSTRLTLSELSEETAAYPGALIYREGLMPFAETVIGSRRLLRAAKTSTILCYVGAAAGLLLSYYLIHVGSYGALSPLRMLVFLLLWLLPTFLLSGLVKQF